MFRLFLLRYHFLFCGMNIRLLPPLVLLFNLSSNLYVCVVKILLVRINLRRLIRLNKWFNCIQIFSTSKPNQLRILMNLWNCLFTQLSFWNHQFCKWCRVNLLKHHNNFFFLCKLFFDLIFRFSDRCLVKFFWKFYNCFWLLISFRLSFDYILSRFGLCNYFIPDYFGALNPFKLCSFLGLFSGLCCKFSISQKLFSCLEFFSLLVCILFLLLFAQQFLCVFLRLLAEIFKFLLFQSLLFCSFLLLNNCQHFSRLRYC